jgi:hypothetical protein
VTVAGRLLINGFGGSFRAKRLDRLRARAVNDPGMACLRIAAALEAGQLSIPSKKEQPSE